MKIAIPVVNGVLNSHFGHSEEFSVFTVDYEAKKITECETIQAPPHEPGLLPTWMNNLGINLVIAGGMGQRAQSLFSQKNIDVIVGAPNIAPEELIILYFNNKLVSGTNICDH